jgi:Flp pilus assembly protein TadG
MHLKREDGAAAIEFAILLPILLMILFGIIEFGFALYGKEVITNASREGARAGIVIGIPRPSEDQIKEVVSSYLTNFGWDAGKAEITVPTGPCEEFSDPLQVELKYPFSFLVLPSLVTDFSKDITLSSTTEMRCE